MAHSEAPTDADPDEWTVTVEGAVAARKTVRAADLPVETVVETPTDCEGEAAARQWGGVRLGTLLDRAGVAADASHVLVRSSDPDFACGFDLARARDAVLAVRVDGDPIPVDDGGPVRLLPDAETVDCWERVKWVASVAALDAPPDDADTAKERVPAGD
jgi:DMSO/TMAO reductase YedYZ molybdopterin-dependent catalytic subunit